jgi:hypothetical protein
MTPGTSRTPDHLAPVLQRPLAPLPKSALGIALGVTAGLAVFLVTVFHVLVRPPGGLPLWLLGQYFAGYDVTWPGAFIGLAWGFVTGFVAGWFAALLRNFFLAAWVFLVRTRAERAQTHNFLDDV